MATPEARAAYLQRACGLDITLRRKVDELLKEHFSDDSLLAGVLYRFSPTSCACLRRGIPLGFGDEDKHEAQR